MLGFLVGFTITSLPRSLEISASIILVSEGEKFKGGTHCHTDTSANSIAKSSLTVCKTNLCNTYPFFKQFVMIIPLMFSTSALNNVIGMGQLTILLILNYIWACSFLIRSSFSSCLWGFLWWLLLLMGYFFYSAHVLVELHWGVLLWPVMGLLVGLSFFENSSNFCLDEEWG